jgi:hypothetical protein
VNTHTLALLALVFSVTSNGYSVITLVRKLIEARARWIDRKLGLHALPPPHEARVIPIEDVAEIRLKPGK